KHIDIIQTEVQVYVNECLVCVINTSIKEKTNIKSVISVMLWHYIQIDLVDFRDFATVRTVVAHLVKDVFRILGPSVILQSDNRKKFEGIVKQVYELLKVKIKHDCLHHPQLQEQIERLNQTIGCSFTKFL
ncbi:3239_t:CDS:2, partial [Cetraspora pellucida]